MRINLQFIPDAIHNLWINSNVPSLPVLYRPQLLAMKRF